MGLTELPSLTWHQKSSDRKVHQNYDLTIVKARIGVSTNRTSTKGCTKARNKPMVRDLEEPSLPPSDSPSLSWWSSQHACKEGQETWNLCSLPMCTSCRSFRNKNWQLQKTRDLKKTRVGSMTHPIVLTCAQKTTKQAASCKKLP